jgi:hypothetical protein
MTKHKATALLLLTLIPIPCTATTIFVFVTRHGIVVGSDSKMRHVSGYGRILSESTTDKFALIQNHIIIASIGESDIRGGEAHYNFLAWIKSLQSNLSSDISIDDFTKVILTESAKVFATFNTVLENGTLKQQDHTEMCKAFIQYVIVGYQGSLPKLYVVQFYIDWNNKKLVGPLGTEFLMKSTGDAEYYGFGMKEAITDFTNRQSYAYKQALILAPQAFRKFIRHRDISLDEAKSITMAVIKVEEQVNPSMVGGEIRIAEILPNGRALQGNTINDLAESRTGNN